MQCEKENWKLTISLKFIQSNFPQYLYNSSIYYRVVAATLLLPHHNRIFQACIYKGYILLSALEVLYSNYNPGTCSLPEMYSPQSTSYAIRLWEYIHSRQTMLQLCTHKFFSQLHYFCNHMYIYTKAAKLWKKCESQCEKNSWEIKGDSQEMVVMVG